MALVAVDQLMVPKQHRGWLTGIAAAIKITPLVFLLIFVIERDIRAGLRALGSFLALTAGMVIIAPGASRQFWLGSLWDPGRVGTVRFAGNQSLWAIANRLSGSPDVTAAAWIFGAALALVSAIGICKWYLNRESRAPAVFAIAVTGLLCSPISWTHHWVWVVTVLPLLWKPNGYSLPGSARALMLLLVIISIAAPYWWFKAGIAFDLGSATLPLTGLAVLITWRTSLWRADRRDLVRQLLRSEGSKSRSLVER